MKKINYLQLNRILKAHSLWLEDPTNPEAERADLRNTVLSGINEQYVKLRKARLDGADLKHADLSASDLSEASLVGADLTNANLSYARLTNANLLEATLCRAICEGTQFIGTNLSGADMTDSILHNAKLEKVTLTGAKFYSILPEREKHLPLSCPEEGAFIAFKLCRGDRIVKLEIPADAKRTSGTDRKCRASKARVIKITDLEGVRNFRKAISQRDENFIYKVGETLEIDNFDENRWNECSAGIHFFITRDEAVYYMV